MKKIVLFLILLLMVAGKVEAIENIFPLQITNSVGAYMEIPPTVVFTGAKQLNLTTGFTFDCVTFGNILTDTIALKSSDCFKMPFPDVYLHTPETMPTGADWRRNYNGIFTQHLINTPNGQRFISINHGENKNEIYNGKYYQNTINPNIDVHNCASGYVNGVFQDCFEAYHAFINLSWQIFDSAHSYGMANQIDEGPIVWPSTGYVKNGILVSNGLRHPHGLIVGDYIYLFYNDTTPGSGGTKLSRAPISSGGLSGSFKNYCNGSWVTALPEGFDKNNIKNYFDKNGGCSSRIIPIDGGQISFAVARRTDGGYLGVEENSNGVTTTKIRVYTSNNLIDWILVAVVNETATYVGNKLHYPIFLNSDGTNNELVNPQNFYVVGASAGVSYALPVSITVPTNTPVPPTSTPIPTMTPTPVLGDYDGDRDVDLADFGYWKTRYLAVPPTMTLADFGVWKKEYLGNN